MTGWLFILILPKEEWNSNVVPWMLTIPSQALACTVSWFIFSEYKVFPLLLVFIHSPRVGSLQHEWYLRTKQTSNIHTHEQCHYPQDGTAQPLIAGRNGNRGWDNGKHKQARSIGFIPIVVTLQSQMAHYSKHITLAATLLLGTTTRARNERTVSNRDGHLS
jgi:hypothetical protein